MLGAGRPVFDASPSWRTSVSRSQVAVVFVVLLAAAAYIVHPPAAPDLAAQTARVEVARSGHLIWWSGWFEGLQLPAYSTLSPLIMAWTGIAIAAALAALGVTAAAFALFKDTQRPLAGVAAISVAGFADILAGRTTFALGAAAAMVSVALIRRGSAPGALLFGAGSFLLSPLAGLFLGLAAVAVVISEPLRRRPAAIVAISLAAAGLAQIVAFPGSGTMPFPWWHMTIALVTLAIVAAVCPGRTVRVGCALVAAATVLFFVVPSPVGTNIVRLTWLVAAPVVASSSQLKRLPVIAVIAALAVWPAIDLGIQLDRASSPASHAAFFQPLLAAWRQQAAADGRSATGERVELVDPATQWGADYLAPVVPIARGWDRPTDRADNPLFYDGTLTNATYGAWLHSVSAGWVALPRRVGLDYASVAEAAVVRAHPSYLRPVWQDASWQLFRVVDATPVVRGATLLSANEHALTFRVTKPGLVQVTMRWSRYLHVRSDGPPAAACVINAHPWTTLELTEAGTYTLGAALDLDIGRANDSCPPVPALGAP